MPSEVKGSNAQGNMFLRQFWQSFVEDRYDLDNAIQTKAEFSYAIAVMDQIEGWEEESWVGSKFPASLWIHTKGCDLQRSRKHARVQEAKIQIHHGSSELCV